MLWLVLILQVAYSLKLFSRSLCSVWPQLQCRLEASHPEDTTQRVIVTSRTVRKLLKQDTHQLSRTNKYGINIYNLYYSCVPCPSYTHHVRRFPKLHFFHQHLEYPKVEQDRNKNESSPCRVGRPNGKGTTSPCPRSRLCIPKKHNSLSSWYLYRDSASTVWSQTVFEFSFILPSSFIATFNVHLFNLHSLK